MKTLKQLKEENAAEEAKATETEKEEVSEEAEEEPEAVEEESGEDEPEKEEGSEESEQEETETESWMQSDDEGASQGEFKPDSAVAAVRRKLKGKLSEKDDELAKLRQELDQLKQGGSNQQSQQAEPEAPKRPKLADYDYDEDKYHEAYERYTEQLLENKFSKTRQTEAQKEQARKQQELIEKATETHYERAGKLVEQYGIKPEQYQQADMAVRQAVDSVFTGQGDQLTDAIIARLSELGEGSEKVMYKLGIDPAARSQFLTKLQSDGSGLSAMAYLGQLQATVNSASQGKKVSNAPKPGKKIKGDANSSASGSALKRSYERAHKEGNLNKAFKVKRQAKKDGVDTSNW